jgi:hypothetical protein
VRPSLTACAAWQARASGNRARPSACRPGCGH